ncbi:MAG: hypothetical protein UT65_C0001G0017 [Parcubacteria group bacterium GW2011_GWF2_39_8b]|uniref:Sugar O-methyltransferase n=3 Tax=Candidatus Zambryskiibacteriota TaxID=1817925 RepID=A0A1G2T6Z4_9BACT|nr:MAG: hypothetical protein UT65_C0001G0017 [Parcubacteria group bacterium GW2011_GWF2_39_8b]KKR46115.1 MAG: hypothetical protein UT81_C0002G0026 [Parcubacteria group bacterium GW2011_GWA2_40_14]OHA93045.1 MAG: hypothetical protein A2W58_02145 [Candidatus Zambryskibacteria bacterium RIFCSPHIGHO2_02_38_10.5]OHA96981.1 MAG: hypothetical protein A3C63_02885 [Candidatus Zambryskibacteria bacterium RIFCSPHIGHO2_02_FULL_39_82]OHA97642.1 MAG: hypothetical protein A3E32_01670 [Candidatus Zambryskibact
MIATNASKYYIIAFVPKKCFNEIIQKMIGKILKNVVHQLLIKCIIIKNKFGDKLSDWMLPEGTEEEKFRISILRNDINSLPKLQEKDSIVSEQEWDRHRMTLRDHIMRLDPRNFLRWPVVISTMFFSGKIVELEYLKSLPDWAEYDKAITESTIGKPKNFPDFKRSSGNLIHHAYSIALFSETFSLKIKSCHNIFEFGGGYGSLVRFMYQFGFTGKYIIFDLPEFSFLQKYYLSGIPRLGIDFNKNTERTEKVVSLTTTIEQSVNSVGNKPLDIFIALWSLSECPIALREEIFKLLPLPKYFLIAYQEKFNNIDNVDYFKKLAILRPEYRWIDFPILHLPGNRYFFGKKIEG